MPNYNVRIQHDDGIVRIKTYAKDRDTAIEETIATHGVARDAILSCSKVGGNWINAKHLPYKWNGGTTQPAINFHRGTNG